MCERYVRNIEKTLKANKSALNFAIVGVSIETNGIGFPTPGRGILKLITNGVKNKHRLFKYQVDRVMNIHKSYLKCIT